jgi:NADPH:quinone reductase-like Zn-dependent oxidoreductase
MDRMKVVCLRHFGGPETLELDEVAVPQPGDDEMLVRVHAASVNPVDYKIRKGGYPMVGEDKLPLIPGRDLAGIVERTGARVRRFKPGDAIYAMLGFDRGAFAEYALVKESEAAHKPTQLDFVAAAAVPLAGLTAWQGLFDHGRLKPSESVLIHGGAGGVGHLAIQFARAKGATVLTTASSDDIAFVRDLGADRPIDYKTERFEDIARGVALVFDLIGGETLNRSYGMLRQGGRVISTLVEPDPAKLAEHGIEGKRYLAEPSGIELTEIASLINAGVVRIKVARSFSLDQAGEAERMLEAEHPRGKLVLKIAA